MTLALTAIGVRLPPSRVSASFLGAAISSAYLPLYAKAGTHSRPHTVRRGVMSLSSPPYEAPILDQAESCEDAASAIVGELVSADPSAALRVRSVLHVQCTLNQQVLGSACLRLVHSYFKQPADVLAIGQLGTVGVPTALALLPHARSHDDAAALACVSASDKWVAPFYRRIPGLVTYGDAAAACMVAPAGLPRGGIAVIERIMTSCQPSGLDPWVDPADRHLDHLHDHARDCIETLLRPVPTDERRHLRLAGDDYAEGLGARVARSVGLEPLARSFPAGVHLASASPLAAIADGIASAQRERSACRLVVWTATMAGHAAALLVTCEPSARRIPGGWVGQDTDETTDRRSPAVADAC
jgi:hypothetical protein